MSLISFVYSLVSLYRVIVFDLNVKKIVGLIKNMDSSNSRIFLEQYFESQDFKKEHVEEALNIYFDSKKKLFLVSFFLIVNNFNLLVNILCVVFLYFLVIFLYFFSKVL